MVIYSSGVFKAHAAVQEARKEQGGGSMRIIHRRKRGQVMSVNVCRKTPERIVQEHSALTEPKQRECLIDICKRRKTIAMDDVTALDTLTTIRSSPSCGRRRRIKYPCVANVGIRGWCLVNNISKGENTRRNKGNEALHAIDANNYPLAVTSLKSNDICNSL